jgi:hypothetical protein
VVISNYFTRLFSLVRFVEQQNFLKDSQKYDYVKILRANMSKHELYLLTINALTSFGSGWIIDKYPCDNTLKHLENEKEACLITKYQLIKNMNPRDLISVIGYLPKFHGLNIRWSQDEIQESFDDKFN